MPLLINYKETQSAKEKYLKMGITSDIEIWLTIHGWKIRKLGLELDGKPLAELIRLDEKLLVVINEEEKKMLVLNDVECSDF
ncbi:hypothetical protein [Methanobacterium bryantii]|uniref:Uncharacterized protein n=1 Tax=Methanobacterium bryantii TaxID=2161 RepID=A0A2A2H7N7_METBR|nr:hypothetical protein [Methanobacterium bryantii]PAV05471.1 hypothetical protein ASJ80_09490 [Methanobacterium bryantii]